MMEIEFGFSVVDKNNKPLGEVAHIVMDGWSGEPRKYMVRLDDGISALYFTPDNVADVAKKKVKLNIAAEEMEQT